MLIHFCRHLCRQRVFNSSSSLLFSIRKMSSGNPIPVAVMQLNCKSNKDENFSIASDLISKAASIGCQMAFLPECFDMVCESRSQTLENLEPIDGPLIEKYKKLACDKKIWLSLGGLHEKVPGLEKAKNAHIVINSEGDIVAVYRKIHLFNLDIPGVVRLVESEFSVAGNELIEPVDSPVGKIGLGICYDVRFPEQAISLAKSGADILTYPSAFTGTVKAFVEKDCLLLQRE